MTLFVSNSTTDVLLWNVWGGVSRSVGGFVGRYVLVVKIIVDFCRNDSSCNESVVACIYIYIYSGMMWIALVWHGTSTGTDRGRKHTCVVFGVVCHFSVLEEWYILIPVRWKEDWCVTRLRNVDFRWRRRNQIGRGIPTGIRVHNEINNNQQGQCRFSIEMRMIDALCWFFSTTTGSRVPVFSYDIIEV